jgi:hypothetical protein
MVTLPSSITIQLPPFINENGEQTNFDPITLSAIEYTVSYDNSIKICRANIKNMNRVIVLWRGQDYDAAGNWTDADTDARLLSILGSNPQAYLQALVTPPTQTPSN